MRKTVFIIVLFTLAIVASSFINKPAPPPDAGIKWMTWSEMLDAQKKKPKKVVVDVYTQWCGWCKRMEKSTFEDKSIINYVNDNFYAVKFDAETKQTLHYHGRDYSFVPQGANGYNELAAEMLKNQMAYPTTVYFDENMTELFPVPGYEDSKMFETVLNYVASNSYKTTNYDDYQKTFAAKTR